MLNASSKNVKRRFARFSIVYRHRHFRVFFFFSSGLKADPNWWSFLCTDAPDVRTEVNNTLCEGDVGGPLFNIIRKTTIL